jgi:hypothetical protein
VPDRIDIDFSDLSLLIADIGEAPVKSGKKIRQAVEVTARKVKDAWKDKLEGTEDLPHGAATITYDLKFFSGFGSDVIEAEIGAERYRKQAPIVTVLEFGAPGNNLSPRGYGAAALQENEADFLYGLELATEPLL